MLFDYYLLFIAVTVFFKWREILRMDKNKLDFLVFAFPSDTINNFLRGKENGAEFFRSPRSNEKSRRKSPSRLLLYSPLSSSPRSETPHTWQKTVPCVPPFPFCWSSIAAGIWKKKKKERKGISRVPPFAHGLKKEVRKRVSRENFPFIHLPLYINLTINVRIINKDKIIRKIKIKTPQCFFAKSILGMKLVTLHISYTSFAKRKYNSAE